MEQIFIQLGIILLTAFIVSYIVRAFKQPIIIGYILAGIIISPFIVHFGVPTEITDIFSKFGIAFLLFMVGLHMNPKVIKEVGTSSLLIGLGQIILTFGIGFFISLKLFGFNLITSAYVGIALAFSSTIIVMKLLSDKQQLDSLYGKISIGILIVQDLVAAAVLMFISSTSSGIYFGSLAMRSLIGGGALILGLFLTGYLIFPKLVKNIAKSQELLFLFSITWAFGVAALFNYFGFSIEIGALMAGIVLSISPYGAEIGAKIKPLRDFFLIIFFIIIGLNIQIPNLRSIVLNAVILSMIVLIFKPLILMVFMGLFKHVKRTSFFVGTTLAQISEFSLIVLALGVSVGHISGEILSTLTLTGIITITISTYFIIYSNNLYRKVSGIISIFERKKIKKGRKIEKKYDAILFGYNRIGFSILRALKRLKLKYLIIDFDPDIISDLEKLRFPCLYGDASDVDFLNELPLDKLKLAISTIPDFETNELLIETIRLVNPKAIIIARAHQIKDALELYRKGATYVLTPHFLGGEYVARMLVRLKDKGKAYEEEKKKHVEMLKEMMERGHEHPKTEKNFKL